MITITCPELEELNKKLNAMGKELPKTYDEVMENLVDEAVQNARAGYDGAREYVHPDDYEAPIVTREKIAECDYIIHATGKEVCFYEFGAGYTTDVGFGFALEMPFMVSPGSWSASHKQQFTKYGRWYSPNGHYYTQIPPMRAMFNASQFLRQRIENGEFK